MLLDTSKYGTPQMQQNSFPTGSGLHFPVGESQTSIIRRKWFHLPATRSSGLTAHSPPCVGLGAGENSQNDFCIFQCFANPDLANLDFRRQCQTLWTSLHFQSRRVILFSSYSPLFLKTEMPF